MSNARFKMSMFLHELQLPFDQALAAAKEIGAEYVWFDRIDDETPLAEMSDRDAERMAARVSKHGLKLHLLRAGSPFKQFHLTDLDFATMEDQPAFRRDLAAITRSIQLAAHLGVGAVCTFTFAWPGEYTAGKPTWPMRWLTRGGVISDGDMEKLVKAFSLVLEQAERYAVDVAVSMMPWNYTNTTSNFRRLAERLGSPRLKALWGPADNFNSGEADVATAGYQNMRPYLHGLHLKDLRVIDGQQLHFQYCPLGTGDVDYVTILRQLRVHHAETILAMATHFRPASGSPIEAMRTNFAQLAQLISQAEDGE